MDNTATQNVFQALLAEDQQLGPGREVAKHLAGVALYELKGESALHRELYPLAQELKHQCQAAGIPILITNCFRTAESQNILYAQGRTAPGSVVTHAKALQSYHNYGLAFDFCFAGTEAYPDEPVLYQKVGAIGKTLGLVWGGDFGDIDHFEYHPGFTWEDLEKVIQPKV
jgi:peptidoglycan L-alanyl-D-glutamate endopeptidase CwlK